MIDIKEFVEQGYLLEANRQFFHRLGLALTVSIDNDTGTWAISGFQDARDDPEGWVFAEIDDADRQKAANVAEQMAAKDAYRQKTFGWTVQPLDG